MRGYPVLIVSLLLLIAPRGAMAEVGLSGYLKTDNRIRVAGDKRFTWNENSLSLKLQSEVTDAHLYGEILVRGFGFPEVSGSAGLGERDKDKVIPWAAEIREVYIDLYAFLLDNMDLRIGRQRIAWGTADKLNPTDNLNPDDLEDVMDFGRKLGTNSLKASYYLGGYTITGVYVPVFTPAVLPPKDWAAALSPPFPVPPGLSIRKAEDRVILPENRPGTTSMGAIKVTTSLFNYDLSLSYFYGRDDLPILTSVELTPVDSVTVDVGSRLEYPRMQVLGTDLAGEISGVGVWAEGALFFPKQIERTTVLPAASGSIVQTEIALDDEPYFKYVIGGDYTFKNGFYINGQYLHGFIHERGEDNLEDYLMLGIEKKFMNDELKLTLAGAVETESFDEIRENWATVLMPEIEYYPMDDIEITVGSYLIDGKDGTVFGKVKENDELYLKVKFSF